MTSEYLPRLVDEQLDRALRVAGAVVLQGPRACGKTAAARRVAASEIRLDATSAEARLARMEPASVLDGAAPRLIDEWQTVPEVWNEVRHAVDDRRGRGSFVLTGSAWPEDDATRHSGAGRIVRLRMEPMSQWEQRRSTGECSLSALLSGGAVDLPSLGGEVDGGVTQAADWIVRGGWPGWWDLEADDARLLVRSYVDEVAEHDFPLVGGPRRDPRRIVAFLRAYAGLSAQPASFSAIGRRVGELLGSQPGQTFAQDFHDFASRMFLVADQPAWSTSLRSATTLAQTPKRHLVDPSLACAALGVGPSRLLADLNLFGHLFESLVVRDLRAYAQSIGARGVFHLRDSKGRDEIDAVVEAADGSWVGVEVKLGIEQVDAAAESLLRVAAKVDPAPSALAVVVPGGRLLRRSDGVWIVPLGALGP